LSGSLSLVSTAIIGRRSASWATPRKAGTVSPGPGASFSTRLAFSRSDMISAINFLRCYVPERLEVSVRGTVGNRNAAVRKKGSISGGNRWSFSGVRFHFPIYMCGNWKRDGNETLKIGNEMETRWKREGGSRGETRGNMETDEIIISRK